MVRLFVTVCFVIAGVAALIWGMASYLAVDDLKNCPAPNTAAGCESADAIIAISGGDTQARTTEAIRLYKAGWAPKLIFSGAARDTSGPSNAEAMRTQALAAGVPESAIHLDTKAEDTSQNATGVLGLLGPQDTRIILVTSPYHQRRASIEFERAFGSSVAVVNHPAQSDRHWGGNWWMTPYGWMLGFSEIVKILLISTWRA